MNKFKSTEELEKAYLELEKEFTKKCQKLKEYENEETKTYLIGYVAPNDRVCSYLVWGNNQKDALNKFFKRNPSCEVIAISIWEE